MLLTQCLKTEDGVGVLTNPRLKGELRFSKNAQLVDKQILSLHQGSLSSQRAQEMCTSESSSASRVLNLRVGKNLMEAIAKASI